MSSPRPATPPPPMSTTSLSPSTKPFPVTPPVVKPPVLASDILRDEVAPMAPATRAVRVCLLAFSATFALAALTARLGVGSIHLSGDVAFAGAVATSSVAFLAAIAPLPYSSRAAVAALAGLVPLALGAGRLGPMAALGDDGPIRGAATVALITLLPAALVFRARYRAFPGARAAIASALLASLPAIVLAAMRAADASAPLPERVLAGATIASALTGLFGFMGAETSAGCAQWAAVVLLVGAALPAMRAVLAAWQGAEDRMIAFAAASIGELISSTLVTFALFQTLAAALARRAREVDVHQIVGAGASDPARGPSDDDDDGADDDE